MIPVERNTIADNVARTLGGYGSQKYEMTRVQNPVGWNNLRESMLHELGNLWTWLTQTGAGIVGFWTLGSMASWVVTSVLRCRRLYNAHGAGMHVIAGITDIHTNMSGHPICEEGMSSLKMART